MSTEEIEVPPLPPRVPQAPRPPKKLKPARKQVKAGDVNKQETVQTGKEYNIWYNKWAGGDREDSYSNKTKSQSRCHVKTDSGLTRANTTGMKYICLFFARGCCPYGWECEYRHTLPDETETGAAGESVPDTSKDCFARDKFADYRDDMGGVGSFNRQNRTLYVGRIKEVGTGPETEQVVVRHFREWGTIEKVRVLQYRSVAFVTYVSELGAQFAKEAMACQSLDNDEILNVRWATEDPNPVAKVSEKRRLEDMGREAIQSKMDMSVVDAMRAVRALEDGESFDPGYDDVQVEDMDEQEDGDQRDSKRRRLENGDAEDIDQPQTLSNASLSTNHNPTALLTADTLEGLKYFAEIRKKHGASTATAPPRAPQASSTGLGLADYGSDDDE